MEYPVTEQLLLDKQLCFPLYAAARKVVGLYTPVLAPLHLTYTQYLVLMVLWEEDDIPVGRLGQRLHLDSGTLTPLLRRMAEEGLLEKRRKPEDERVDMGRMSFLPPVVTTSVKDVDETKEDVDDREMKRIIAKYGGFVDEKEGNINRMVETMVAKHKGEDAAEIPQPTEQE